MGKGKRRIYLKKAPVHSSSVQICEIGPSCLDCFYLGSSDGAGSTCPKQCHCSYCATIEDTQNGLVGRLLWCDQSLINPPKTVFSPTTYDTVRACPHLVKIIIL